MERQWLQTLMSLFSAVPERSSKVIVPGHQTKGYTRPPHASQSVSQSVGQDGDEAGVASRVGRQGKATCCNLLP
jgi:hypothetical protein